MEKKKYLLNVIEYITLIILFMLGNGNKLFIYTLCYLFYKVLSGVYDSINVKDSILRYKNKDNIFKNKGYIYSIIILVIYSILGLGISFLLSIGIKKILGITDIVMPLMISSLLVVNRPILDITNDLLIIYNKKKLASSIHYIYYFIDSILLLIIYSIIYKIKMPIYIFTSILFISKVISLFIIISLCLIVSYKKNKSKSKYRLSEFREVFRDFNKSLMVVDSTKYGYFYISFIILYIVLVNRYGYKIEDVYNILVIGYLNCLSIILLVSDSIKYFTNRLCREYSLGRKIIYLLDISIPIVIYMIIMAKYIYMFLFGNIDGYGILMSFSLLVLFITFYDIMVYEYLKVRENVYKYLLVGILIMGITIVPLIDSFYRMGYSLINGSIISIIIGICISLIMLMLKIKVIDRKMVNKYFEKFILIIYQNIILSFILVILQLVINFNTNRMFSLMVIVIYIGIMVGYFRIKKRGINNG